MTDHIWNQVRRASELVPGQVLSSGDDALDFFLGGGLPIGGVSLWTGTLGSQVREVLLKWVIALQNSQQPILWVIGLQGVCVFASAWASRGVDLSQIYFASSSQPLLEMREVFFSPVFPMIILDSVYLSREDQAVLSQSARTNRKSIVLIQNQNLRAESPHPCLRHRVSVRTDQAGLVIGRGDQSFALTSW